MQTEKLLDLMAKCLELANSELDGEALAAARKANDVREKLGLRWHEVLNPGPAPQRPQLAASISSRLSEEVARLQFRVSELNLEAEAAKRRAAAAELDARALREAITESNAAMARRERELRQRMTELEGMLTIERERNQQATARLAALDDIQGVADRRVAAAEQAVQDAHARVGAIESMLQDASEREIALRREMEELRAATAPRQLPMQAAMLADDSLPRDRMPAPVGALAGDPETGPTSDVSGGGGRSSPIPAIRVLRGWRHRAVPPERDDMDRMMANLGGEGRPEAVEAGPFRYGKARDMVVEIKPLSRMFIYANLRRAQAAIDYAAETGADYVIASASGVTLGTLFNLHLDPDAVAAVLEEIDNQGTLSWADYQELRERFDLKTIHTGALVLQENLFYSRLPWRLKRLPEGETFDGLRRAVAQVGS